MSGLPDVIELGAQEEAQRLWQGALDALERADEDLVSLLEALDLGVRVAEILGLHRLEPARSGFPATIQLQLDCPSPVIDVLRDASEPSHSLDFAGIVDLLSEESLSCVAPGMHRGWEDRRFACRRSRATAQGALGCSLSDEDREQLLLLGAYRNRVFRSPPPVRVEPARILGAFPTLQRLVESLI